MGVLMHPFKMYWGCPFTTLPGPGWILVVLISFIHLVLRAYMCKEIGRPPEDPQESRPKPIGWDSLLYTPIWIPPV